MNQKLTAVGVELGGSLTLPKPDEFMEHPIHPRCRKKLTTPTNIDLRVHIIKIC